MRVQLARDRPHRARKRSGQDRLPKSAVIGRMNPAPWDEGGLTVRRGAKDQASLVVESDVLGSDVLESDVPEPGD